MRSRSWPGREPGKSISGRGNSGYRPEVKTRKGTEFGFRVVDKGQHSDVGKEARPGITGAWMPAKNFAKVREPNCIDAVHLKSPFPLYFLLSGFLSWHLGLLISGIVVTGPLVGHCPIFSRLIYGTTS